MNGIVIQDMKVLGMGPYSLQCGQGEIIGIFGESGIGKSLLLKGVADLLPNEGAFEINHEKRSGMPATAWRRKVMYCATDAAWWAETVAEHFEKKPDASAWAAVRLEAEQLYDKPVEELSVGQRSRLALLRSLQYQPEVLLLDEPTANLDDENTRLVEKMLVGYVKEHKACAIWVSHDREQLERVAACLFELRQDESGVRLNHV